ncbi:hypothetical protein ACJX0J_037473, partial [Zea mays]
SYHYGINLFIYKFILYFILIRKLFYYFFSKIFLGFKIQLNHLEMIINVSRNLWLWLKLKYIFLVLRWLPFMNLHYKFEEIDHIIFYNFRR